jgi:hypothetical protein
LPVLKKILFGQALIMTDVKKSHEMITDFITGEIVPDIGAEANRQDVEHFLD